IELLFQEQLGFMEWPDRIQTCASVGENHEMGRMLSDAIQKQVGVKSQVIDINEYESAAKYDALFVPIHLVNKFRSLRESLLILPIVYDFDPDILLSMVDRAAIDTIGLVTGSEDTIPKVINELKRSIHFEGSFVAGTTS
ncbi:MAG TPA: GntR family transcriptional regulator, partial [Balneolaceae bacterium]|nr:GntR family transcriptional regulator [Balneolaceae bacterium]